MNDYDIAALFFFSVCAINLITIGVLIWLSKNRLRTFVVNFWIIALYSFLAYLYMQSSTDIAKFANFFLGYLAIVAVHWIVTVIQIIKQVKIKNQMKSLK